MASIFQVSGIFSGLLTILLLAGCSDSSSDPSLVQVQGTVLVKGKPASYARLRLVPVDEDSKADGGAYAVADEEGRFQLSTKKLGDGARPGKYLVGVSWRIPSNPQSSDDPGFGNELLPPKFQDPVKSGVALEVSADSPEVSINLEPSN